MKQILTCSHNVIHMTLYLFSDSRNGCCGLEWMLQDWCIDKLQLSIICQHQNVWGKEMSGLTQLGDLTLYCVVTYLMMALSNILVQEWQQWQYMYIICTCVLDNHPWVYDNFGPHPWYIICMEATPWNVVHTCRWLPRTLWHMYLDVHAPPLLPW